MPKVEYRLNETKKLLMQRDREIGNLTQTSGRQTQALDEATQINAQQRDELHRLNATLAARAARNRETLADPRFDGEVALRSEIEALRTKTREQAAVINKLQERCSKSATRIEQGPPCPPRSEASESRPVAPAEAAAENVNASAEINRLRKDLVDAENALRAARGMAEAGNAGQAARETEIRTLKTTNEDLGAEVARLRAALGTYEAEDADERTMKDSKVAMRARVSALQAQS